MDPTSSPTSHPEGEQEVFRSFSEEWRDYQYDGWVFLYVSYDDNLARLISEVGLPRLMVRADLGLKSAAVSE